MTIFSYTAQKLGVETSLTALLLFGDVYTGHVSYALDLHFLFTTLFLRSFVTRSLAEIKSVNRHAFSKAVRVYECPIECFSNFNSLTHFRFWIHISA